MGRGMKVQSVAILLFSMHASICHSQAPAVLDAAERMKQAMEAMGKSTNDFMPGFFGSLSEDQIRKLESIPISQAEEAEFGRKVLADFEDRMRQTQKKFVKSGRDVTYILQLIQKIQPEMKNAKRYKSIDVNIINTDELAAYSVPGGHLIFSTGMIEAMPDEAALVGVIAHELSHLDHGHQLLGLRQSKQSQKAMNLRDGMLWMSTMAKPFRPEFESIADSDAVRWSIAAGYDARSLAKVLEQWNKRQDAESPWSNLIPSFARSHPDSGNRALAIYDQIDKTGADMNQLRTGITELQQRRTQKRNR